MSDKLDDLKDAAEAAKNAPLWDKAEKIGDAVDILLDVLFDLQCEIDALKRIRT